MITLKKILVVLFILNVLIINAQSISGIVTSANDGLAISGVSVSWKGILVSTITNANGEFAILRDSSTRVLVFSFIGMETQEINIQNKQQVNVQMLDVMFELEEECVVIGYGVRSFSLASGGKNKRSECKKGSFVGVSIPNQDYSNESYASIHENGFKTVGMHPLSTFSIDVDAASYANVRRFLNDGNMPPIDAVRIEEMINYFTYDYPQPQNDDPFSVNTELSVCPWNKDNLLLHVGLQGKNMAMENLPASNLVFLIDVSGSMSDLNKLPLLKKSFHLLTNNLRKQDRVSIVVYAGNSGLVLPSTPGNQKEKIKNAFDQLHAGGSTAGGAGLDLAYKVAEEHFIAGGNNRIILATDGDFNVGQNSNSAMERLIEQKREKGIFISVLGFGMGNYKDDKMEIIADKGNGNYAYIDDILEAKKVLVNEFGGTLFTIAKDVKFQLEFNPTNVAAYRLIGYENRLLNNEDFDDDTKDAGEMGAGHTVTALYEIIPAKGNEILTNLKYQNTEIKQNEKLSNDLVYLKLRYKQPDGLQSKLIEQAVKNKVIAMADVSDNYRFSAAVAEFGMLLRNSEFKGESSFLDAKELAKSALGNDKNGYRSELLQLIRKAETIKELSKN